MRIVRSLVTIALPLLVIAACSSTKDPVVDPGKPDCDNLDMNACLFPFPSDFFRKAGGPFGATAHLDFGSNLPENASSGARIDGQAYMDHDGFPIYPQVNFSLEGATLDGAPGIADIDQSLKPDAKILLIDAETGELQPQWAEFDYLAEEKGTGVIQLRLANVLQHSKRYIIAVRNLKNAKGEVVPPTPGFKAMRDKSSTVLAGMNERREHFEKDIFPALEKFGIKRAELQLAWDFTTASADNATLRIRTMRDELYKAIGDEGPEYTITQVEKDLDGPTGDIETKLTGIAKVPNFMLAPVASKPRRLRLNAAGLPMIEGTTDVLFHIQIPRSARTAATKASVMQYGHGFLGNDGEADGGWLRGHAKTHNFLILSTNMQGMDNDAGLLWFLTLPKDLGNSAYIGEEPLQGIMNHLALQRMMKGRFTKDPNVQKDGAPFYAPDEIYYHGNSQGGTQGFVVTSMSKDINRAALGEPGISIAYILNRSRNWKEVQVQIAPKYPNVYDFASIQALVSVGWDKGDGTNLAKYNTPTPPADGTAKTLLIHAGLEDQQVNNDVTRLLARLVGATLMEPATRPVWGLPTTPGPISGRNVMVEFDYGIAPRTKTNRPVELGDDPHDKPRVDPLIAKQMWEYFRTGEVRQFCSGVCDPN
jgi:hypothetical protein